MRKVTVAGWLFVAFFVLSRHVWAEPVAVIVNKANSSDEISLDKLCRVYQGKTTHWPSGLKIFVINRESSSAIRAFFYKAVLNAKVNETFLVPGTALAFAANIQTSAIMVKRVVAGVPGAVGYIFLSDVDETVKVLKIDGLKPGQDGYKLSDAGAGKR